MKFGMLPQPVGLLKLILNLFCTSTAQERDLRWLDFIEFFIFIVLCLDTRTNLFQAWYDANTTELYSLIPV